MRRILDSSLQMRSSFLKITEASLIYVALILACEIFANEELALFSSTQIELGVFGTVLWACLCFMDFYDPRVMTHRLQSISRILQAVGLTLLIAVPLLHVFTFESDSGSSLTGMFLAGVLLTTSRCLFAGMAKNPAFIEPALVWGSGPLAANIIHELEKRPDIGIQILGVIDNSFSGEALPGVRYLGSPEIMWRLEDTRWVRRIIVAVEERRGSLPLERLMAARAAGLKFEDGTEFYEELTGKVWLGTFSVGGLLFSRSLRPSMMRLFIKRLLSICLALVGLVIATPVMLITALLIRLDSVGPVMIRQIRVGENGRHFTLFKFRSMRVDSVGNAPAMPNDPRCTRVGKIIRRLRIDELPQLINILKGDMYFVGPRPFVPDQEAELVSEIPLYRQRWIVRPGATGWAQVNRDYCVSIEDNLEKLSYDLFYIKNLSLRLDLLTLAKTVKVLVLGRGGR